MNSTRRGVNRLLLFLLGAVLLAAGALTVWAGAAPEMARQWTRAGQDLLDRAKQQLNAAPIPGTGTSWWTAAALLLLIVTVILLACWIASQGGGHTGDLGAHDDAGHGTTTVEASFAAQAIRDATAENHQLLSTAVSVWNVKGAHTLRLSLQTRKGASPAEITSAMDEIITGLNTVLGEQIPVLVRIGAGPRTRFARHDRVHQASSARARTRRRNQPGPLRPATPQHQQTGKGQQPREQMTRRGTQAKTKPAPPTGS